MIRPINIYMISRIRDERTFCVVEKHDTGHTEKKRIRNHEIDSLRLFVDKLVEWNIKIENLEGYKDYRRKYQNIAVADEDDARPIEEQLRDIFGDGPIPELSNLEFRKKK